MFHSSLREWCISVLWWIFKWLHLQIKTSRCMVPIGLGGVCVINGSVKHCITRQCCSPHCIQFTVYPLAQNIQVNCFLQLWIFPILRDMLNKVVLKTWLDHLGCFSAVLLTLVLIWGQMPEQLSEKKEKGLLALKESQSLDKNAMTDGQSLNSTQHSLIS